MAQARGIEPVGYFDCPGGGQVVVSGTTAYVAHMKAPHGTTVVDVSDPAKPRKLAEIAIPPDVHSHKVRVMNDVMLVNREAPPRTTPGTGFRGGLGVFDVSRPDKPREIAFWECKGVHRFTFDGRYRGNIVGILDLNDPAHPQEVGRWWMPGQWIAGGETPTWEGRAHRCHHPIRLGNRLYVSYWHGGFVILDIEDMGKPRLVSGLDWSPPFSTPTHTALPIPFPLQGRRVLLVADEDVMRIAPGPPAFLWLVDVSDETRPTPFASFQVDGIDGSSQPEFTGCHQPCEEVRGTEIPVAWFAHGLRIVDIANPHAPREVASFVPDAAGGGRVCSNDVCYDARGLMYLIDRDRGLHIVERT
ncbi:MAG TPA: hypothetical protein VE932_12935 [Patescibacteria group bacterium]|nr:hypothetical protein [Patescibacteria group bacterium]